MPEIVLPAPRYGKSSRGTPRLRRTPRALHGAPRLASRATEATLRLDCCDVLPKVAWVHFLLIPVARGKAGTYVLIHFGLLLQSSCFRILTDRGSYRSCVSLLCSITRSKLRSRTTMQRRDVTRGSAALWLFTSRRQAHFLLEHHKAVLLMPNVRAKRAPTAWRAGQQAQNGPKAQRLMAGAPCRWRSA